MTELTPKEVRKACQIGSHIAAGHGYAVREGAMMGRGPTDECNLIIVVVPGGPGFVHVVLEIQYMGDMRVLHPHDVHAGEGIFALELVCATCDTFYPQEIYDRDYFDEVEPRGHICEGGMYWDDDGKGGFTPCTRTDTQWYESGFLLTGSAGWFCPHHVAQEYREDLAAIQHARKLAQEKGLL